MTVHIDNSGVGGGGVNEEKGSFTNRRMHRVVTAGLRYDHDIATFWGGGYNEDMLIDVTSCFCFLSL